jgi:hypothetical protein
VDDQQAVPPVAGDRELRTALDDRPDDPRGPHVEQGAGLVERRRHRYRQMDPCGPEVAGRERVCARQHEAGQRPAARLGERGGEQLHRGIRPHARLRQIHDHPAPVEQLCPQHPPHRHRVRRRHDAPDGEDQVVAPITVPDLDRV